MRKIIGTVGGKLFGWNRWCDEGVFRDYDTEAKRLMETVKPYGFDEYIIYDEKFIKGDEFYPKYAKVLDKVSFGFAFKSMAIYDMLANHAQDGDVIIFTDSNHVLTQNPQEIINIILSKGCFIRDHFQCYYPNKDWSRRDTFVNMDCDSEIYWNSPQMQANLLGFVRNEKNLQFTKEWRDSSLDYDKMFGNNQRPNFPSFKEHRHDQTLLSLLTIKYKMPYLHRNDNPHLEDVFAEIAGIKLEKMPEELLARKDTDRLDIR